MIFAEKSFCDPVAPVLRADDAELISEDFQRPLPAKRLMKLRLRQTSPGNSFRNAMERSFPVRPVFPIHLLSGADCPPVLAVLQEFFRDAALVRAGPFCQA